MLIHFENEGSTQHHGGGKQIPLNFQPTVGADVKAITNKSITGRNHGGCQNGECSNMPKLRADFVYAQGEL